MRFVNRFAFLERGNPMPLSRIENIVIAPDSFKGSLTSMEVVSIIKEELLNAFPHMKIQGIPIADGGEGTLDALLPVLGGERVSFEVHDPLLRKIPTYIGIVNGADQQPVAIIEMAKASGILLVDKKDQDPMKASSYGTGELLMKAVSLGAKKILMGIGGSATNDGGTGFAQAIGVKFYDCDGQLIVEQGAQILEKIHKIDCSKIDQRLFNTEITVICDVDNPMTGTFGATKIYGPQKGVTKEQLDCIDDAMLKYGEMLNRLTSRPITTMAGSGAAGGLGAALMAFLDASLKPGVEAILDLVNFEACIKHAELVITGEGRVDAQTLHGKVPMGVARRCREGQAVLVICGSIGEGYEPLYQVGVQKIIPIMTPNESVEHAMIHAKENLRKVAKQLSESLIQQPRIWIDADGCPVVDLTIQIAKSYHIPVTVVKNYAVKIESDYADVISVDISRDAADYYIANHIFKDDLVVTQDNGLAAMILAKNGICMNQNGKRITSQNIDFLLDSRYHSRIARDQSGKGPKHKKRTSADDDQFKQALHQLIREHYL